MINTVRHNEIFAADQYDRKHIVVVGGGAIGGRVLENLGSAGLTNITMIDFDVVESHNLANQLYLLEDIGKSKVAGCYRWAQAKCGKDSADAMNFINGKVDKDCLGWFNDASIVISCVDSFEARRIVGKMAVDAWADLFIDTRMATGHCEQYMINPDDGTKMLQWEGTLGDDNDPSYETSACGESLSVGATAQAIGAVTGWSVMNFLKTGFIDYKIRMDTAPWLVSRAS